MSSDRNIYFSLDELARRHDGRLRRNADRGLVRYELRGFSQNGEDGVIAEILRRIGTSQQAFVEFGVESGREGNCVFLADILGWSGLFMEADEDHFRRLSNKYAANHRVQTLHAVLTPNNVEQLFDQAAVPSDLDVLPIDIDSSDYWIWEAITSYRPRIVVIEYNAALGVRRRAVQPRDHQGG